MSRAIWVASGWLVAAMPCGAMTSLRVAKGLPVMRSAAMAETPEDKDEGHEGKQQTLTDSWGAPGSDGNRLSGF